MEESESDEGVVNINGHTKKRIKLESEDNSNEPGKIFSNH
jgi:hypothetical protein